MEKKQSLFIYDRKEILVLLLLGVLVSSFAFTFGVHLGKRVGGKAPSGHVATEVVPVETLSDQIPHRQEMQEQAKISTQAAEEALSQALHDEVARTGIRLEVRRQVDLPHKTRAEGSKEGGKSDGSHASSKNSEMRMESQLDIDAARRKFPPGEYTLEVGTSTSLQEMRDRIEALEALGMKPMLRSRNSAGKEKMFGIYLGAFRSKEDADHAGERYRAQHVIQSFTSMQIGHFE